MASTNQNGGASHPASAFSTRAIHADGYLNQVTDVAPPMHMSSTFRYDPDPAKLVGTHDPRPKEQFTDPNLHIYSRHTAPNSTRIEAVLSSLLGGRTLVYASGLAALHAILTYLRPKRFSIGDGYHGSHGVAKMHEKLSGMVQLPIDCPEEELQAGDVIHLETPVNPTGRALSVRKYAEKARRRGAFLIVDATFGPPPLQNPLELGADVVMHSGTKYLGGHADLLFGALALAPRRRGWFDEMLLERMILGSKLADFESWLAVRSLRTLELRVRRQSESATKLVAWLDGLLHPERAVAGDAAESSGVSKLVRDVVLSVEHASLQVEDKGEWLEEQMKGGYGPVFAFTMKTEALSRHLPSRLEIFQHATSLGSVESLIEWRTMTDETCDKRLMRVSVGVEGWEDLRDDLLQAFRSLSEERFSDESNIGRIVPINGVKD